MLPVRIISIDAMGGDHGPDVVVTGVTQAVKLLGTQPVRFLLHGDPKSVVAALDRQPPVVRARCEVRPSNKVLAMDEKPAQAMRRGAGSSMWNAVQAVKNVEAHAVVSAGNIGALMAISKLILRMVTNMERPALIANWPTMRGHTAMLDVGANLQCDPDRLVQFAIMGAAFHHALNHSVRPTVGLLNVGSGVETGHQHVLEAHRLLHMAKLNFDYHGFVEGDDITTGIVDVVVTDGFTGNVALKTGEGAARLISGMLRRELNASPLARFGAVLVRRSLRIMVNRLDGGSGGPFLGLNGIVVKVHGGTDAKGFAGAIRLAADLVAGDFSAEIDRSLKQLGRVRA